MDIKFLTIFTSIMGLLPPGGHRGNLELKMAATNEAFDGIVGASEPRRRRGRHGDDQRQVL